MARVPATRRIAWSPWAAVSLGLARMGRGSREWEYMYPTSPGLVHAWSLVMFMMDTQPERGLVWCGEAGARA